DILPQVSETRWILLLIGGAERDIRRGFPRFPTMLVIAFRAYSPTLCGLIQLAKNAPHPHHHYYLKFIYLSKESG
ncbi:hypothetical protein, partial [Akkermansia muciniphila]|uniref:hypothetical protein n=2 Tax=Akkermansia TaxID=239934 RepID=UPI001EDD7FF1